jgi:hypothetical protein
MKKLLLLSFAFALAIFSSAQCDPNYDFGEAAFGVSPDPENGETFNEGILGSAYADVIHIKVPTSAADIDPTFPQEAPIDSIILVSVYFNDGTTEYSLEDMGLTIECNNLGDSPDPCTFLGGNQYCAALEGTPLLADTFQLIIAVDGWTTIFGVPVSQPVTFDQYELIVVDPTDIPTQLSSISFLSQNTPNPFGESTKISFGLNKAATTKINVLNLLGEVIFEDYVQGTQGDNVYELDGSQFKDGIYLYSIESNGNKMTKRMVVNR